jgi:hypothetical protein
VHERAGQPVDRTRVWRWCARSRPTGGQAKPGAKKRVVAMFGSDARVELIGSTLRKHRADGIRVGMPAQVLNRRAEPIGDIWVRRAGAGRRFAYGAKNGRVSFVALAGDGVALGSALQRAGLR